MAPKHKWGSVSAKSREQVADLMGRAMAEGSHKAYGSSGQAMVAVRRYKGKLPLREVLEALDEDFLDQHGEIGSRFLWAWLGQLGPFEQMEIADQHLLSLVDIEHSYGIGAQMILESLERITAATADKLAGLRAFTEGPDAEVAPELADRLEALAPALRDVNRSVADIRAEAIKNVEGR